MSPPRLDLAVIGGGIIGVTIALELQRMGRSVTILEREGIAAGASFGNAGAFAFTDVMPLASPGIVAKAPFWLLDPLGPLSIPPRYALRILPWMLRFWRASGKAKVETSARSQTALMTFSKDTLGPLVDSVGARFMLREEGQMQLYEGEKEWKASLPSWRLREALGIPFRPLSDPEEIAAIQPGISPDFTHACYTPIWASIADPADFTQHLALAFRQAGGVVEQAEAVGLSRDGEGVTIAASGSGYRARQVVVATGAWSRPLALSLGDRIPLETERGYNTTLPAGAFDLRTHLTFPNHGFVVTRIGEGVRVGGAVELGGLQLPPNYARSKTLLAKAKRFLPALKTEGGKEWMGFRPSLPDSLPVIGASPRAARVIYAFGHGHSGLTQASGTAKLVADLVSERKPRIDLHSFRADRF